MLIREVFKVMFPMWNGCCAFYVIFKRKLDHQRFKGKVKATGRTFCFCQTSCYFLKLIWQWSCCWKCDFKMKHGGEGIWGSVWRQNLLSGFLYHQQQRSIIHWLEIYQTVWETQRSRQDGSQCLGNIPWIKWKQRRQKPPWQVSVSIFSPSSWQCQVEEVLKMKKRKEVNT